MRFGLIALAALALTSLAWVAPAFGDDSSAALKAGGIVFTKSTPVRMAAEDLYVSPTAVRIRFAFHNPASRDVDTIVAFPLPDISTFEFWNSPIGTVTDDPKNFVGFNAVVDGKAVPFTVEQRAFVGKRDVTAIIAATGAPINPVAGDGYVKLAALAKDKKQALVAAGLAQDDGDAIIPQWTVRTRFWWRQRFPAGKTVVIAHSYQPITGQSFLSAAYQKRADKYNGIDYCFDAPAWARLEAMSGTSKDTAGYMIAYQTAYILKTAGNWQGPIGHFHLTLDKLRPDNVISLCWDGALKKTGPTTFEFSKDNFAPRRDLNLIVLEKARPIE